MYFINTNNVLKVRGSLSFIDVDGDVIVVGRPNFYPSTMSGGVLVSGKFSV